MLLRDRHAAKLLDTDHGDWRNQAACREHDPELWFPLVLERGAGRRHPAVRAAVAVCNGCPVRQPCLHWATEQRIQYGVWGGLTPFDRARHVAHVETPAATAATPNQRAMRKRQWPPNAWPTRDQAELQRLVALGATDRLIASVLGRSREAVKSWRRAHRIPAGATVRERTAAT